MHIIPVKAVQHFQRVTTTAGCYQFCHIKNVADEALKALGIDKAGLDDIDRKVLQTIQKIYQGGPVGIETLAATLNEEPDTIMDTIEPYLLKAGFLKRTPRGREVTSLAREHFKA